MAYRFHNFQKLILLSLLALGFFSVAFSAHATITVTAPSSGTSWQTGTTHTISWSGGGSWVTRIYLDTVTPFRVYSLIASNFSNTGSYSWTIPTSIAPATNNYLIYVETATCNGCGVSDWGYGPQFTITAPASNSAFISQTPPPSTMIAGQVATVSVTMQNTGGDTWTQAGNYRLGSQNPQDNTIWGSNRTNLPVASVAPGASATFTFNVTAPTTPGTYNFQRRMLQEGITWFGAYSTNVTVTVTAPDTTSPTVSVTAPAGGSTVSGTATTVSANASDNIGVVGVQFKVDGTNIGAEDTASPYSVSWNTTAVANGSHTLTAVARDAAGNSATSAGVSVTVNNIVPDTMPPSVPTGLGASAVSSSQINLSWNASTDTGGSGLAGYNVYRNGGAVAINTSLVTTTSYSDTGRTPSTSYFYAVRARDGAGNQSGLSASAPATTQAPPPPPNVSGHAWAGSGSNDGTNSNPGIGWIKMSGTAGDGSPYGVLVSSASPGVLSGYAWANPNDGAQNHIGWIDFGPAGSYPVSSFVPAQSARLNRTTGVVTGWARVCSVFASGCSGALRAVSELGGWDGWIGFGSGGNYTQPVTVSGCNWSGYAWGGGTNIGWIHFGGALYPTTGSGDACAFVTPQCSDGIDNDGDGLTDFGPGPLNDPGCIDGNDIDEVGPAAPSGLSANAGSGASCNAMVITWTDNSTDESRFELERKLSLDPDTAYVEIAEPSVNATSFTDTGAVGGLLRDTSYAYRIRACNAFGCGAYSNTNSAINQNPLPSFTWTPPSPLQNANTIFNASASTIYGGSSASEYFWTLTDGIPATFCSSSAGGGCDNPPLTPLASTRFQLPPSPEQKSVILRVTDSASRSCSLTQTVSLRINSTLPHWREEAPE